MNPPTRGLVLATAALTALLLATSPVAAASKPAECTAAERDKPTLDVRVLPGARFRLVTEPIGWERDDSGGQVELTLRHGEEAAQLSDGVTLTVTLGGCETYTNSYGFSVPGGPPISDGAYWLRRASALLTQIAPANLDSLIPLPALADILAERAQAPAAARDLASVGLGGELDDGVASYRVEIIREAGRTIVTVSYSIPL